MEYRVLVLFLLTTQTSTCVAELTGDNVCPLVVREIVSLRVKVKEPVTIKEYTWCFRLPPRCSKYRVEMRDKFKIQHEQRNRTEAACCSGYAPDKDNTLCVAVCSGGCLHGMCDQPENCACEPGYAGRRCDAGCEAGWFGVGCSQQCQCDNGATCHHVTGVCNCVAGWRGVRCDIPCAQGSYGEGCLLECRCGEFAKCHHITGECEVVSTTLPEEVTSQTAAYHFTSDDVETLGTALTSSSKMFETAEVPSSTSPVEDSDRKTDSVKFLPVTEEYPKTQGSQNFYDENITAFTTTFVTSTQSIEPPSTNHLDNAVRKKEADFEKKFNLFGQDNSSYNIGSQLENIVRLPDKLPDWSGDHTPAQDAKNFLVEEKISYNNDKPSVQTEYSKISRQTETPGIAEQDVVLSGDDVVLSGDDVAELPPPPSNDLQHLRQLKPTEAETSDEEYGVLGGDLLSTSCVSAAVAVALIFTATFIVAVAHWRKSSRKKEAASGSESAAMAVYTYNGSVNENVFPAQEENISQVSVSVDGSHLEHSPTSDTASTLQSEEQKRSCDFRDSMTSHYDIPPPPARLSLPEEGRGEPIYEEIRGWSARGATSTFLTFGGVLETSRV